MNEPQRLPGTFTKLIDGVVWRQCRDCRPGWFPETIEYFQRQNKALSRKLSGEVRPVWDCRCRSCSRIHKAARRAFPTTPRPHKEYDERKPQPPKLPKDPPKLTWASLTRWLDYQTVAGDD